MDACNGLQCVTTAERNGVKIATFPPEWSEKSRKWAKIEIPE